MKKFFILFMLTLLPLLVMGQIKPLCPTCKKVVSKCQYNGKHPKPQPNPPTSSPIPPQKQELKKQTSQKQEPKKKETKKQESKKQDSKKQTTKKKEPKKQEPNKPISEAAGYDVTFSCNVSSASMTIDGIANGMASGTRFLQTGSHTVWLSADGYEPLLQTVNVNSSSTSFSFTLEQVVRTLSPTLQNLVNNMVRVEGGTFWMGATSEQGNYDNDVEKPIHQVTLSSFYISKYEVTQEEWQAVMGNNPSIFKDVKCPVEYVSWNDCQEFILKLNRMTGKRFRLPTEAEWEYAARGGNRSRGYKYAGSDNLDSVAWYGNNSGLKTHAVGQRSANELGLYDMSGNVWEWCYDWYGSYSSSSQTDPTGPPSGSYHVIRGGSYGNSEMNCRSSIREIATPSNRYVFGLRLAL